MGPLVPDIIGPNLNFVLAIGIGIAFGWILEQAGFSSSRKLVGLFYGYDFTVLRVFFTAGIVAMSGIIALQHFGLLDINLVYINPTYIWSALVGGAIMGLGFVIGGFCPGTSVCAAAIGRTDAMMFIAGSGLGVLLFATGYPWFEGLYTAGFWGNPQIFETLNMSKPLFVVLLTTVALFAFWAVYHVEGRVNRESRPLFRLSRVSISMALLGGMIAISGVALPSEKDYLLATTETLSETQIAELKVMSVDEFAFRLLDDDPRLRVIDFRSAEEMERLPLPNAVAFTRDNLFEKDPMKLFRQRGKINIIVADDVETQRRTAVIASRLGYENVRVLEGGAGHFEREILGFDASRPPASRHDIDTHRFRSRASRDLPAILAEQTAPPPVPRESKRAAGGC